jgi:rubrerythrin
VGGSLIKEASMSNELAAHQPFDGDHVKAAFNAVYNWNYEGRIDEIRTLYANALHGQWIALRDLDWEGEIDREVFGSSVPLLGLQLQVTDFWHALPAETRWRATSGLGCFMLSNFLHGEQGALMVAAQLVNAVPDMDAKFYAATQTLDEARHVEVFSAYIRKLGRIFPIAPAVKGLLDTTIATDNWYLKAVGMQVVTEGLALYMFREMRGATREPLLKQLLTYVSRDEARHTGYGIKYLSRIVPTLSLEQRGELEDFAFEATRILLDSRSGTTLRDSALAVMSEAGVDLAAALPELAKERDKLRAAAQQEQRRRGPVRGFIIPTLRAVGLFSERIESHFDEIFARMPGSVLGSISDDPHELPEDLEAWVLG